MESNDSETASSRKRIASVFIGVGVIVLISGLLINPWTVHLYRANAANYQDVTLTYFTASSLIGILIIICGAVLRFTTFKVFEGITLLVVVSALIVLSDRLLLAFAGLPLWVADAENHYVHRANAVRTWGTKYEKKLIRINQYGHHDRDFPIGKTEGEFRGLALGDSITMGHGVTAEETFSGQLENMLGEKSGRKFEIINTGVQGYATFQEYNVLVDSLKFKPDFITIQFCVNDLTEPFIFDRRFGGTGTHFSGVAQQSSAIVSYFLNETGYGRTVQRIRDQQKTLEFEQQLDTYNTKKAAGSQVDDPTFSESWKITLSHLDKIYEIGETENIRVVLLICPHTFQIVDERLRRPQKILAEHAKSRNVDVIDFTDVFDKLIFERATVTKLLEDGVSTDEIEERHKKSISTYFLDQDHYTVEGHRIVAHEIYEYLSKHYSF